MMLGSGEGAITTAINLQVGLYSSDDSKITLAASLFHYKELEIIDLKNYLMGEGIPVRL